MTLVEIIDSEPPFLEHDLKDVEFQLGVKLPGDYLDFVRRYNGGRISGRAFRIKNEKGLDETYDTLLNLSTLYSIQRTFLSQVYVETFESMYVSREEWKRWKDAIPEKYFPLVVFGQSDMYWLYSISCSKETYGQIVIFYPTELSLCGIADSFASLLSSLEYDAETLYDTNSVQEPWKAAEVGNWNLLEEYLGNGLDVNATDSESKFEPSLLSAAAAGMRHEVVKKLIDLGADPNQPSKKRGQTPMHFGIECRDVFQTLHESGGDINAMDEFGMTPAHRALGLPSTFLYLIQNGADLSLRTSEGKSVMDFMKSSASRPEVEGGQLPQKIVRHMKRLNMDLGVLSDFQPIED